MKQQFKVAYILTPIEFGGAEKVSLEFFRNVNREKFDIHPILLVRPWEQETYFARELRGYGFAYDTVPVGVKTNDGPLRILRAIQRIYSLLKISSFDLVHTHGYFADICALPVAKMLGINSVSTCHGFIGNDRKLRFYNMLDRLSLRLSKGIITVSEDIMESLTTSGIKKHRIKVIQNAISQPCEVTKVQTRRNKSSKSLSLDSSKFVIGYIGRLSEEKGVKYLIEAASILRDKNVDFKLIVVGDGPERAELENLVKERSLEEQVVFVGFQTDVATWLTTFDVFVLPSLTEGTPMALLEAMSMGIPVIATAVGGVPKVLSDGKNGLLVSPHDFISLSERIQILQENSTLRERLSREGSNTIRTQYNITTWCRSIENCYLVCM